MCLLYIYIYLIGDADDTFTLINHTQIVSIEGDINLRNLPNISECGPL